MENSSGEMTVPWGEPVDVHRGRVQEVQRSQGNVGVHLYCRWESLSQRRWGCMQLKAEEKSRKRMHTIGVRPLQVCQGTVQHHQDCILHWSVIPVCQLHGIKGSIHMRRVSIKCLRHFTMTDVNGLWSLRSAGFFFIGTDCIFLTCPLRVARPCQDCLQFSVWNMVSTLFLLLSLAWAICCFTVLYKVFMSCLLPAEKGVCLSSAEMACYLDNISLIHDKTALREMDIDSHYSYWLKGIIHDKTVPVCTGQTALQALYSFLLPYIDWPFLNLFLFHFVWMLAVIELHSGPMCSLGASVTYMPLFIIAVTQIQFTISPWATSNIVHSLVGQYEVRRS